MFETLFDSSLPSWRAGAHAGRSAPPLHGARHHPTPLLPKHSVKKPPIISPRSPITLQSNLNHISFISNRRCGSLRETSRLPSTSPPRASATSGCPPRRSRRATDTRTSGYKADETRISVTVLCLCSAHEPCEKRKKAQRECFLRVCSATLPPTEYSFPATPYILPPARSCSAASACWRTRTRRTPSPCGCGGSWPGSCRRRE